MFRSARLALVSSIAALLVACSTQAPTPSSVPTAPPATSIPSTPPTQGPVATSTPEPTASTELSPGAFPTEVLGLPVKSVAEMAALATAGKLDGRFVAVGGYWAQTFAPCPFTPHLALLAGFCYFAGFADTASAAENASRQGNSFAPIAGPGTPHADLLASVSATPVVLIVHGNDARAWQCAPDVLAQCHRRLVIDAVVWANGQPTAPVSDSETTVVAFETGGAQLMDVDPRFAGLADGPVRYTRTIDGVPDADGTAAGAASLVDMASGDVLDSKPMALDSTYDPGRLIVDAVNPPDNTSFSVDQAVPFYTGRLGRDSSPMVLGPGDYVVRASIPNAASCDMRLTVGSGGEYGYIAHFAQDAPNCTWREGARQF